MNCHFPGKPDPFIDFALDLSFGLPHLGYVYNGFHLRGPQSSVSGYPGPGHLANRDLTEAELVSDGNTVRPAFVPADSVSPVTSSCLLRLTQPCFSTKCHTNSEFHSSYAERVPQMVELMLFFFGV